jgi:spermidine/putrescine transport system ATP-binding protein
MPLELKRIQREVGITFIYVTHDQEEALTMSDRIAVMSRGKVEQIGGPEEIYDHPRSLFVAGFIGEANLLEGQVRETHGTTAAVTLIDGTTVEVARTGERPPGEEGHTVLIRPENVQLGGAREGGWQAVEGTIVESVYQGPVVRYEVEVAPGQRIVAAIAKEDRPPARPGDRVAARWRTEHGQLLAGTIQDSPSVDQDAS